MTNNPNARCGSDGSVSFDNQYAKAPIIGGFATIYTCGASSFTVSYVGGANSDNYVDNSSKTKTSTVSPGDFPVGVKITKVTVEVDFRTIDGRRVDRPGRGNPYANEDSFRVTAPDGTSVWLVQKGSYRSG